MRSDDGHLCSCLETLSDIRSNIILTHNLAQPTAPVPPSNHEITRLQRSLDCLPRPQELIEVLQREELDKLVQDMHDSSNDGIARATAFLEETLLGSAEESIELERPRPKEEIERAWWADYHNMLEMREEVLDEVCYLLAFAFSPASLTMIEPRAYKGSPTSSIRTLTPCMSL